MLTRVRAFTLATGDRFVTPNGWEATVTEVTRYGAGRCISALLTNGDTRNVYYYPGETVALISREVR